MLVLVGLAILALMVASAVVGVRLLLLWRRSRQKPELYLGLMMMLLAVIGYPLLIASRAEDALGFGVAWPLSVCVRRKSPTRRCGPRTLSEPVGALGGSCACPWAG